ncbi:MAG: universal stress protein [Bacteroidota bacterium]
MIHFKHSKILIPVDFSETSLLAIRHGAFIASFVKADLHLLHVVNQNYGSQNMFLPLVSLEIQTEIEKKAIERLNELAEELKHQYQIEIHKIVKLGSASTEISQVAKEIGASLIVMGTHGYSVIKELVIGSTAMKVLTKAPCPTMVTSVPTDRIGYTKIVLPIDNTVNTKQKVHYALEMAKQFSATLYPLGLLDSAEEDQSPNMEMVIHQIEEMAKSKGVMYRSNIVKNVKNRANTTVEYCQTVGADLVIIMTDQDAEVSGFFLGPYSQQIIHLSKVPVIAIRPEELYQTDGSLLTGTSSG